MKVGYIGNSYLVDKFKQIYDTKVPNELFILVDGVRKARCFYKGETDKAFKVLFCHKWVWVPKSQATIHGNEITIPSWYWIKRMRILLINRNICSTEYEI